MIEWTRSVLWNAFIRYLFAGNSLLENCINFLLLTFITERSSALIRILFVCHGNICRSTMAECVLTDLVHRRGLDSQFEISSAGTSDEETGNPIHPGTRRQLKQHGIPELGHRAVQMTRADYSHYDLIVGMDSQNIAGIRAIAQGDPQGKVHLLMEFAGENRSIPDPWYTGDFESTYRDVSAGCAALLDAVTDRSAAALG